MVTTLAKPLPTTTTVSETNPLNLTFITDEVISRRPVPGYPNIEKIQFYVPLSNLPLEHLGQLLDVNPRMAGPSPQVHNGIFDTLSTEPEQMAIKCAGLILSGKTVRIRDNKVTVIMTDAELHGLIDGNHTRHTLKEFIQNNPKLSLSGCIELTIYVGMNRSQVVSVGSGHNIRKPVQKSSLLDFTGYFDIIRTSLGSRSEHVKFYEGDTGVVRIESVIAALQSLNTERYGATGINTGNKSHPLLYAHTGNVLKEYEIGMGDNPNGPPHTTEKTLSRAALQIMHVYDKVRILIPEAWNAGSGTPRSYGKVQPTKEKGNKGKTTNGISTPVPFLKKDGSGKVKYQIPEALSLLIFAAFRANVDLTPSRFSWQVPIEQFINEALPGLTDQMYQWYNDVGCGNKPFDFVAKRAIYYREMYQIAEQAVANIKANQTLGVQKPAWRKAA